MPHKLETRWGTVPCTKTLQWLLKDHQLHYAFSYYKMDDYARYWWTLENMDTELTKALAYPS